MSKYKKRKKFPDARIESGTSRIPGGPLNPLDPRAIVITKQNCRVWLY